MAAKGGKLQRYTLDPELYIQDIYRIKEALDKLYKKGQSFELDFSNCERIDLAVLQIFLSFCIQSSKDNKAVKIAGPLHPNLGQVLEDADLLGIIDSKQVLFPQVNEGGYPVES